MGLGQGEPRRQGRARRPEHGAVSGVGAALVREIQRVAREALARSHNGDPRGHGGKALVSLLTHRCHTRGRQRRLRGHLMLGCIVCTHAFEAAGAALVRLVLLRGQAPATLVTQRCRRRWIHFRRGNFKTLD